MDSEKNERDRPTTPGHCVRPLELPRTFSPPGSRELERGADGIRRKRPVSIHQVSPTPRPPSQFSRTPPPMQHIPRPRTPDGMPDSDSEEDYLMQETDTPAEAAKPVTSDTRTADAPLQSMQQISRPGHLPDIMPATASPHPHTHPVFVEIGSDELDVAHADADADAGGVSAGEMVRIQEGLEQLQTSHEAGQQTSGKRQPWESEDTGIEQLDVYATAPESLQYTAARVEIQLDMRDSDIVDQESFRKQLEEQMARITGPMATMVMVTSVVDTPPTARVHVLLHLSSGVHPTIVAMHLQSQVDRHSHGHITLINGTLFEKAISILTWIDTDMDTSTVTASSTTETRNVVPTLPAVNSSARESFMEEENNGAEGHQQRVELEQHTLDEEAEARFRKRQEEQQEVELGYKLLQRLEEEEKERREKEVAMVRKRQEEEQEKAAALTLLRMLNEEEEERPKDRALSGASNVESRARYSDPSASTVGDDVPSTAAYPSLIRQESLRVSKPLINFLDKGTNFSKTRPEGASGTTVHTSRPRSLSPSAVRKKEGADTHLVSEHLFNFLESGRGQRQKGTRAGAGADTGAEVSDSAPSTVRTSVALSAFPPPTSGGKSVKPHLQLPAVASESNVVSCSRQKPVDFKPEVSVHQATEMKHTSHKLSPVETSVSPRQGEFGDATGGKISDGETDIVQSEEEATRRVSPLKAIEGRLDPLDMFPQSHAPNKSENSPTVVSSLSPWEGMTHDMLRSVNISANIPVVMFWCLCAYTLLTVPILLLGGVLIAMAAHCYIVLSQRIPARNSCSSWFVYRRFSAAETSEMRQMRQRVLKRRRSFTLPALDRLVTDTRGPILMVALDGGGIRGAIAANILKRLAAEFPQFMERVQVLAGASTGSFPASLLAFGYTPEEVAYIYDKYAARFFTYSFFDSIVRTAQRIFGFSDTATGTCKYRNENMMTAIQILLGEYSYADVNKHLVTVSLNVEDDTLAYGPQTHHTFANIRDTSTPTPTADKLHLSSKSTDATIAYDGTKKLCDYCVMSSSVATLFPPHLGQVDGGLVCNNPALIATSLLLRQSRMLTRDDVAVLSISTGHSEAQARSRGFSLEGAGSIDRVAWAGDGYTLQVLGSMLPTDKHCRIDPKIPADWSIDATDKIPDMVALAQRLDLSQAFSMLQALGLKRAGSHQNEMLPCRDMATQSDLMETKLTTLPADFTTVVDTQKTEDTRVIDGIGSETWSAEPVKTLGAKVDDELVSAQDPKNRQTLCDVRHNNNTPDVAHDTSYLHDHQSADSDLNEETRRETSTAICDNADRQESPRRRAEERGGEEKATPSQRTRILLEDQSVGGRLPNVSRPVMNLGSGSKTSGPDMQFTTSHGSKHAVSSPAHASTSAENQAVGHDTLSCSVPQTPPQDQTLEGTLASPSRGPDTGADSCSERGCVEDEADTKMNKMPSDQSFVTIIVDFTLKLLLDFSKIGPAGSSTRLLFHQNLLFDLSAASRLQTRNFHICKVSPGSIFVEMQISSDSSMQARHPRDIVIDLMHQMTNKDSILMRGYVTRHTEKITFAHGTQEEDSSNDKYDHVETSTTMPPPDLFKGNDIEVELEQNLLSATIRKLENAVRQEREEIARAKQMRQPMSEQFKVAHEKVPIADNKGGDRLAGNQALTEFGAGVSVTQSSNEQSGRSNWANNVPMVQSSNTDGAKKGKDTMNGQRPGIEEVPHSLGLVDALDDISSTSFASESAYPQTSTEIMQDMLPPPPPPPPLPPSKASSSPRIALMQSPREHELSQQLAEKEATIEHMKRRLSLLASKVVDSIPPHVSATSGGGQKGRGFLQANTYDDTSSQVSARGAPLASQARIPSPSPRKRVQEPWQPNLLSPELKPEEPSVTGKATQDSIIEALTVVEEPEITTGKSLLVSAGFFLSSGFVGPLDEPSEPRPNGANKWDAQVPQKTQPDMLDPYSSSLPPESELAQILAQRKRKTLHEVSAGDSSGDHRHGGADSGSNDGGGSGTEYSPSAFEAARLKFGATIGGKTRVPFDAAHRASGAPLKWKSSPALMGVSAPALSDSTVLSQLPLAPEAESGANGKPSNDMDRGEGAGHAATSTAAGLASAARAGNGEVLEPHGAARFLPQQCGEDNHLAHEGEGAEDEESSDTDQDSEGGDELLSSFSPPRPSPDLRYSHIRQEGGSGDVSTARAAEIGLGGLGAPSTPGQTALPQLTDQRGQEKGTEDTETGWQGEEEEEEKEECSSEYEGSSHSDADGDVGAC